jgi:hypothetical protein
MIRLLAVWTTGGRFKTLTARSFDFDHRFRFPVATETAQEEIGWPTFKTNFEDKEDLLRNDSTYEIALAPYSALQGLKARMRHDKLVEWVQDPAVVIDHRRPVGIAAIAACRPSA